MKLVNSQQPSDWIWIRRSTVILSVFCLFTDQFSNFHVVPCSRYFNSEPLPGIIIVQVLKVGCRIQVCNDITVEWSLLSARLPWSKTCCKWILYHCWNYYCSLFAGSDTGWHQPNAAGTGILIPAHLSPSHICEQPTTTVGIAFKLIHTSYSMHLSIYLLFVYLYICLSLNKYINK